MKDFIQNLLRDISRVFTPTREAGSKILEGDAYQHGPTVSDNHIAEKYQGSPTLVWESKIPYIAGCGKIGYGVLLDFGYDRVDDFEIPEVTFSIEVMQQGSEWLACLEPGVCLNSELQSKHQQKVDALVAELNAAIQSHTNFDLTDYIVYWKKQDTHFRAAVMVVRLSSYSTLLKKVR